jgi:hypothetical protein
MPLKRSSFRGNQRDLLPRTKRSSLIAQISTSTSSNNAMSNKQDFWRDPAWQSAGVIVAVILFFLTILAGWKQNQKKSLSYSVISKISVLDIEDSIKSKVQVTFESKPVQDLYLVVIKFINSGNTPIHPNDYYQPITIAFDGTAEILSVEILDQSPKNLGVITSHTSQSVEIPKILLNQKDCFNLKVLVTNFQHLSVDGRIAGVKTIQERDNSTLETNGEIMITLTAIIITAFSGVVVSSLPFTTFLLSKPGELIFIVILSIMATFLTASSGILAALKKNIKG